MAKILVADDEHAICDAFSTIVTKAGHDCVTAASGYEAIDAAGSEKPDVIFLDVRLPDMSGLSVLEAIRAFDDAVPVIIMTAHGTIDTAMQAMRGGAFDYLGKPLDLQQIRALMTRALELRRQPEHAGQPPLAAAETLIGSSAVMQEIFKMMSLLSGNDLTVLITGESGVGKEMVARGIHQHSTRAEQPFVAVNCAAIPDQLLESELFGHEKGAFSGAHARRVGRFEAAGKGTLFLDEVFELPLHLQSKLLRALQERTFERLGSIEPIQLQARIVAASNRPPQSVGGDVREDLYHRLSLINLNIPALRERREDIPALARHFLAQANAALGKRLTDLDETALQRLAQHPWTGNVRELDHTIKRSVLTASGPLLTAEDLRFETITAGAAPGSGGTLAASAQNALRIALTEPGESGASVYHDLVSQVESALIAEALDMTEGNQVAAAQLLGINRTTLRNKMPDE